MVNPCAHGPSTGAVWRRAAQALAAEGSVCGQVETRGDGADVGRIAALVREREPAVIVAAGGDGTLNEVVHGVLQASPAVAPAVAIVPLGTANNVARALGLQSCRTGGEPALNLAIRTALAGVERRIDLGRVNERYFVGSFAIGMDADILRTRNRARQRLGLRGGLGGYSLYLWSCACNLLRPHGASAWLRLEGPSLPTATESIRLYNLLVANTPIYAGEFRFAAGDTCDDGQLDLLVFTGPLDYAGSYVRAWPRHRRHQRGRSVRPATKLRRIHRATIELTEPVVCQIDGEEGEPSDGYAVRVVPQALTVRVPAQSVPAAER